MKSGRHLMIAFVALLAIFAAGTFASLPSFICAVAEEAGLPELEISVDLPKEDLSEPGEVTLSFTLSNQSDLVLQNLKLLASDGTPVQSIGDLTAFETKTFSQTHSLLAEELEAGKILYAISCETLLENYSYPIEISLHEQTSEPVLEFQRQFSSRAVASGDSVTVVYRVTNVGTSNVYALSIQDSLGDFENQREILEPEESVAWVQRVPIAEDTVSAPVLTYSGDSAGENVYTLKLDEAVIAAADRQIHASLTAGRSMYDPDTAEVILYLSNGGGLDCEGITIYDDIFGGIIADSIQLPAGGGTVEITHSYAIRGDGTYRWRIVGTDAAGNPFDFVTDTLSVPDVTGDYAFLSMKVIPSMTKISRSGYVPIVLSFENTGSGTATNVQIHEESMGDVGSLAVVPTGSPTQYHLRLEVRQNTRYVFSATYADALGQLKTVTAEPIEITIGAGGEMPELDDSPESLFDGISRQMGDSKLFMILLIGSCVMLAILLVVLFVTSGRARKQRKARTSVRKPRPSRTPKAKRNAKK